MSVKTSGEWSWFFSQPRIQSSPRVRWGSPSGAASGVGRLKLVRAKLEYFDWPPHPL
jgi:hypothetical protein